MVVCWWGDGENVIGGGERRLAKDGAADAPRRTAAREGVSVAERSADCGAAGGGEGRERGGAHGEGGGQQQQCREIAFPATFSVEKVGVTPNMRFFREACCPDLDFVAHGLVSPSPAPSDLARPHTETEDAYHTRPGDLDGAGDEPTLPAKGEAKPAHAPPGSTKCLLVLDMFEWLGAVSCGLEAQLCREPSPPEPYLSEFETPRHLRFRRRRTVCRARLRGLLPPPTVARCIKAAGAVAAMATDLDAEGPPERLRTACRRPDGCSWGAVTVWPFRDAPRAYAGADARCYGGERSKRGRGGGAAARGGGKSGVGESCTKDWPVGGHGVYSVVACPYETAVAHVSARCRGPGW